MCRIASTFQNMNWINYMKCEQCKKNIDKRTIQQNRYFHKAVTLLADEAGYSLEEMKVLIKHEFGLYDEFSNKKTGETFYVYKSTANLTKSEFADLTEKLLIFCNRAGILIQTPEEYFES